jgi:hypothetical protein
VAVAKTAGLSIFLQQFFKAFDITYRLRIGLELNRIVLETLYGDSYTSYTDFRSKAALVKQLKAFNIT